MVGDGRKNDRVTVALDCGKVGGELWLFWIQGGWQEYGISVGTKLGLREDEGQALEI